jgi:hypothetical protein
VSVVDVVREQIEQLLDLVVIEVIAKRRVEVLQSDADPEPLEVV